MKKKKVEQNNWRPVKLDTDVFANGVDGIEGLVGIEELHDYNIENFKGKKKLKRQKELSKETQKIDVGLDVENLEETAPSKKKRPKTKKSKSNQDAASSESDGKSLEMVGLNEGSLDMTAWKNLFTPEPVLQALTELGFAEPTQIQTLALPSAIMGKRDILGAAETGSGKTLAFGIPILHGILKLKEMAVGDGRSEKEKTEESADESSEEDEENLEQADGIGCVKVISYGMHKKKSSAGGKLFALILTPTRELAIQVKNHLMAAAKYCNIKVATVVGGMSQEKQERVLSKGPEIVVATPGRLWELIKEGNPHLQQVDSLRFLVIDEADRMLEKGHFQELQELLDRLETQRSSAAGSRPQTMVFSATLTLVHEPPARLRNKVGKQKKKPLRVTPGQKLQELVNILGMQRPKIIDVTAKQCTAETLTEAYISCTLEEKDAHLYSFLQRHPGRTIVFCNSVTCVRRLMQLFTLLQCKPSALHAHMAQRQRLRSLDRFAADPRGLLLATDVAARGLDIPNVQHVIHFQVPRTSESYVHRSGRTARAQNAGLTILFVEPKEMSLFGRLCRTLGREETLPEFPVDGALMAAVHARVQAARQLETLEHSQRRTQAEEGWLNKAAEELDLYFDEHDKLPIRTNTNPDSARKITAKRKALMSLLKTPLVKTGMSAKYPTSTGSLKVPYVAGSKADAISLVQSAKPGAIKMGLGTALGIGPAKKRKIKHKKKKKSLKK